MARIQVASLAQVGPLGNQQLLVIGPVRIVAVQAAFPNRRMLPEERPAFLRVAAVALLVYGICDDQLRRVRAVRIVATDAIHQAFPNGMMRCTHRHGLDGLMARRAGVHDALSLQLMVAFRAVDGMATL